MPNKVKSLLQSLRSVSDQINRESDQLLRVIKAVEQSIGRLNIGIPVWLDRPILKEDDPQDHILYESRLSYAKADDKSWGLYVCHDVNGETQEMIRLADATREEKILAMEHLESLIEQLVKAAQQKANRISSAKAAAEEVLEELGDDSRF